MFNSRTALDREYGETKFTTEAWERRKKSIAERVKKKQLAAHQRAVARKQAGTTILSRYRRRKQIEAQQRHEAKVRRHRKHAERATRV